MILGDGERMRDQVQRAREPITVLFPFSGKVIGGSHISALGLIENLDPREFKALVVVQHPSGKVGEFFRSQGVALLDCPMWRDVPPGAGVFSGGVLGTLNDLSWQVRFLRRLRVNIVHTNDGCTHVNWAVAARLAGCKLVWHHRSDPATRSLRWLAPLVADRVISVSRYASPRPGLYSAASRLSVIHSPFDTSVQEDRSRARRDILQEAAAPAGSLLVGYFGLLIDRKRPARFIEAIAAANRMSRDQPVIGLMFGQSTEPEMDGRLLQHAYDQGVGDKVMFMGFRSRPTHWLAGCDVLLVPAVDEPFGRTLVEAMLVETPIVAARSGGNPEALKDGALGTLVAPDDVEAMAAACLALAEDPVDARAQAKLARSDSLLRFGVQRHVAAVSEIYRQLTGSYSRKLETASHALRHAEAPASRS